MIIIRKYYNLIILLICVGAFPVAVVSSNDITHHEADICKFHTDQSTSNLIIPCDHCSYYFDIASDANHKETFMVRKSILLDQNKKEFKHTTQSFFKTSRSPPHSYI
tara:strand:- start:177 stop:497 length:321 start_codon:yes stop_codon:yes gene_type:complete